MKRIIDFDNLKHLINEAMSAEDKKQLFEDFRLSFFNDLLDNTTIDNKILDEMIDKQVPGNWEFYGGDDGNLLALTVKGYGRGNWRAFNKDGRAEAKGISIEDYSNYIQQMNVDFFYKWDDTFKKKFGIDLYTAGRSGGHWGFKVKDLIYKVFEPNNEEIKKLFDKLTENASEEELMFPDDLVYYAMNLIDYNDEFDKFVKFEQDFVDTLENFAIDISNTSSRMESQEFNDELFNEFESEDGV